MKRYIMDWVSENPGKALGIIGGFVLGLLVVFLSIVKTLIVLLFILLGYIIGKMIDERVFNLDLFRNPFKRK